MFGIFNIAYIAYEVNTPPLLLALVCYHSIGVTFWEVAPFLVYCRYGLAKRYRTQINFFFIIKVVNYEILTTIQRLRLRHRRVSPAS